jgi:hypothetical protein
LHTATFVTDWEEMKKTGADWTCSSGSACNLCVTPLLCPSIFTVVHLPSFRTVSQDNPSRLTWFPSSPTPIVQKPSWMDLHEKGWGSWAFRNPFHVLSDSIRWPSSEQTHLLLLGTTHAGCLSSRYTFILVADKSVRNVCVYVGGVGWGL